MVLPATNYAEPEFPSPPAKSLHLYNGTHTMRFQDSIVEIVVKTPYFTFTVKHGREVSPNAIKCQCVLHQTNVLPPDKCIKITEVLIQSPRRLSNSMRCTFSFHLIIIPILMTELGQNQVTQVIVLCEVLPHEPQFSEKYN